MSTFFYITDLIQLMMNEAEKLMKGSVHEDNLFIVHAALVLIAAKEKITWMKDINYFHSLLLTMNGFQDGIPYAGRHVGNSPEFTPLDNSLNRYILHSFYFRCFLSLFVLDGEETNKEESNMCFSLSTPKEISRGLKRIWEPKMGTPYSARMIQDVDLALKAL